MSEEQELNSLIAKHFNAQAASEINATFQLNLKDGEQYFLKVSNGSYQIEKGEADDPEVTLTTDQETLEGIITGQVNGIQAFMTGKIKFSGNMEQAMKLKEIFS